MLFSLPPSPPLFFSISFPLSTFHLILFPLSSSLRLPPSVPAFPCCSPVFPFAFFSLTPYFSLLVLFIFLAYLAQILLLVFGPSIYSPLLWKYQRRLSLICVSACGDGRGRGRGRYSDDERGGEEWESDEGSEGGEREMRWKNNE